MRLSKQWFSIITNWNIVIDQNFFYFALDAKEDSIDPVFVELLIAEDISDTLIFFSEGGD
jgi:hypothetical protein